MKGAVLDKSLKNIKKNKSFDDNIENEIFEEEEELDDIPDDDYLESFEEKDQSSDEDDIDHPIKSSNDKESADSYKSYLKEIGGIEILSRKEEIEIARSIYEYKCEVMETILQIPYTYKRIAETYKSEQAAKSQGTKVIECVLGKTVGVSDDKISFEDDDDDNDNEIESLSTESRNNNFSDVKKLLKNDEILESKKDYDCAEVIALIKKITNNYESFYQDPSKTYFPDDDLIEDVITYNLNYLYFICPLMNEYKEFNDIIKKTSSDLLKYALDDKESVKKIKENFAKKYDQEEFLNFFDPSKLNIVLSKIKSIKNIERKIGVSISKFKTIMGLIVISRQKIDSKKKEMTNANLKLVISIAKKFNKTPNYQMSFSDMIQEGNIGLMKAVDKFEFRKGFKFSTYATWWIKQSITRAIADQGKTIRIPVHMNETMTSLNKLNKKWMQMYGREPTNEEAQVELGKPLKKIESLRRIGKDPISMETSLNKDDDSTLEGFIKDEANTPEENLASEALHKLLIECINDLPDERDREVLFMRYGVNRTTDFTLEDVGKIFDVTRERIRQVEVKALEKIAKSPKGKALKDFITLTKQKK